MIAFNYIKFTNFKISYKREEIPQEYSILIS